MAQWVKNLLAVQEMQVQSLGQEDAPGGGHGNPLQYSCLENPMDRGAWRATVHGVSKSQTTTEATEHTGCVKQIFVYRFSVSVHPVIGSYCHKPWEYSEKGADRPLPSGADILSCWVGTFLDYNLS